MTYVYDNKIDPRSSAYAFHGLTKVIEKMSEHVDCSNLTIYMLQKRKKYITCKILSKDKMHESLFNTTTDRFIQDLNIIANKVLSDWSKVTKLSRVHYFEVKR